MNSDTERTAIDRVAQQLCRQFRTVDAAVVNQVVREVHRRYATHPTREFVPILVEDAARDTLRVMLMTNRQHHPKSAPTQFKGYQ